MDKLRAVIYNRCSTEEESQKDALKKQVQESKTCVAEQGWQLTDCYVEAKSGTTSKGRTEYNRLYRDLERKFYTPDDALITGIKAILAEEYSRELSKKINHAHQNRQHYDFESKQRY